MRKLILAALATAALGVGAAHADPILANGDFETGTFSGWSATGGLGVSNSAAYRSVGATGDTGTGYFAAFGGNGGSGGVLSQDIATTAGTLYNLSFQYGAFGNAAQSIFVTAGGLNQTVTATSPSTNLSLVLSDYTFSFTAAAGLTTTITFTDTRVIGSSGGADGLLDNVSVPEPAGLALLGLGLIGTGLVRRRRSV